MNYGIILDIGVVVFALLFIIFGIWRGFYKIIYGLISSLAAVVLAVVLASTVAGFIMQKTTLDDHLYNALDTKLTAALPAPLHASDVVIRYTYNEEEMAYTMSVAYEANEYESISSYLETTEASQVYKLAGKLVDGLLNNATVKGAIERMAKEPNAGEEATYQTTFANVIVIMTTALIMIAGVFIALWIILYIIIRLIMMLVKKIVNHTYIGHFVDKLLGFVLGAGIALAIIWGVLAIFRMLTTYTFIIPVNELIESSTLTKLLYNNNYLYTLMANANIQQTLVNLIDKMIPASS
ncbi:MAG: CvpA family protein [Clostridia bacterium]|nr:CvpA family protein [Clostridia bacterium]